MSIANFMLSQCKNVTFSRTTLLPVILQNCFATVEEAANGKKIASRFVHSNHVRNTQNVRVRSHVIVEKSKKKTTRLIVPTFSLAGIKREERKYEDIKKRTRRLGVKWLDDLNASISHIDAGTRRWNTHARNPFGPPIKEDYAALPFERGNFSRGSICWYPVSLVLNHCRRRTLAEWKSGARSTLFFHFRSFSVI